MADAQLSAPGIQGLNPVILASPAVTITMGAQATIHGWCVRHASVPLLFGMLSFNQTLLRRASAVLFATHEMR